MPAAELTEELKNIVHAACQQPENVFGAAFFDQHILVVRDYGLELAEMLSADPEIITLAAYLHDLAAVQDFKAVSQHHLLSADTALAMLARRNYPPERAEQVAACIRSHNSPVQIGQGTPEEVCLSNADAIAQLARPAYWLYFAFRVRGYEFDTGRRWLHAHYQKQWDLLIPAARELAAELYRSADEFLRSPA